MGNNSGKGGAFIALIALIAGALLLGKLLPHAAKILLTVAALCALGFIALGIIVIFSGFRSAKNEAEKTRIDKAEKNIGKPLPEEEKILNTSNKLLLDAKLLTARVRDINVRSALTPVLGRADDIIKFLKSDREKIASTRQFLNYYIPTLDLILKKFIKLEANNVATPEESERIISYLSDINRAMERQYQNLFRMEKLDLSVEMEAMTLAFKRDGLISESDYKAEEEAEAIELTV